MSQTPRHRCVCVGLKKLADDGTCDTCGGSFTAPATTPEAPRCSGCGFVLIDGTCWNQACRLYGPPAVPAPPVAPGAGEPRTVRDPHHGGDAEWKLEGDVYYHRNPAGVGQWQKVSRIHPTPARITALAALASPPGGRARGETHAPWPHDIPQHQWDDARIAYVRAQQESMLRFNASTSADTEPETARELKAFAAWYFFHRGKEDSWTNAQAVAESVVAQYLATKEPR